MSDPQHELATFIGAVRRRWQLCTLARTVGVATLAAAILLAAAVLADRTFQPHGLALIFLASSALLVGLMVVATACWRLPRRPDDVRVARFIEEQAAAEPSQESLDDAIVTAASLHATDRPASAFDPLLARAAVNRLRGLAPSTIVRPATL